MPTVLSQDQTAIRAIKGKPRSLQTRNIRVIRRSSSPDGSRQKIILTMSVTVSKVCP